MPGTGDTRCRAGAILVTIALLAAPLPAASDSFRCDGGIVEVGDSRIDLIGKCGDPALAEIASVETSVVERWSYDFGPQRFLYVVTLDGGWIVAIERGGYGYGPATAGAPKRERRGTCEPSVIRVGDRTLDLLEKCGSPAAIDRRTERRPTPTATGHLVTSYRTIDIELWTFDFGPQRFIRYVTLENGIVVGVKDGSYGYAPP